VRRAGAATSRRQADSRRLFARREKGEVRDGSGKKNVPAQQRSAGGSGSEQKREPAAAQVCLPRYASFQPAKPA